MAINGISLKIVTKEKYMEESKHSNVSRQEFCEKKGNIWVKKYQQN
jgi:hypothetical protein